VSDAIEEQSLTLAGTDSEPQGQIQVRGTELQVQRIQKLIRLYEELASLVSDYETYPWHWTNFGLVMRKRGGQC
jgi:hypothetical protein